MTMSLSKYRRLPYQGRLQASKARASKGFVRGHPRHDPKPLGPDAPLARWDAISKGLVRRGRNLMSRVRWRTRRAQVRRGVRSADRRDRRRAGAITA